MEAKLPRSRLDLHSRFACQRPEETWLSSGTVWPINLHRIIDRLMRRTSAVRLSGSGIWTTRSAVAMRTLMGLARQHGIRVLSREGHTPTLCAWDPGLSPMASPGMTAHDLD